MKIAVTGATSFIGLKLVGHLVENESNFVSAVVRRENAILDRLQRDYPNLSIHFLEMDQYDKLGDTVGNIDCLIYLTWNGTRGEARNNGALQEHNYRQGIKAIESVLATGCKKIITAGSQAEYGLWRERRKTKETDIPKPNTEYGKKKLAFYEEVHAIASRSGVQVIEPRFFSLYGPGDYKGTMVISMLENMIHNRPCDLTECIQTWDFLYIDDAIKGIEHLMEDDIESGVYNFGSGESHELKWYVEKMAEITGTKSELNFGAVPYPATGMVNVNPDVHKLMAEGWRPEVSFEDGIKVIIKSIRETK